MENTTIILYTVLTFILTFVFLSGHGRCRRRRQPHPLPPTGPLPLPIIGHLHLLKQNHHQILATISSNHGPILLLSFGTYPVLLVSSPAIAEECFTKNDIIFANRPQLLAGVHLAYNHTTLASTNYGPYWRNLRRIAAVEFFSQARISSLSSLRSNEVHHLLRGLYHHGSEEICMREKLSGVTLNVMAMMLIGKRYGGDDEEGVKLKRVIKEVMENFLPFPKLVGYVSGLNRRLMRLEKEMDALFQSLVDERRRRRSNCGSEEEEKKKPVIDVLLEMQEMEPEYYTDVFIKGFLATMIMAGTDTSTGTMEWAMALLLNHPETLNKARDEISMHVGNERLITDTDVPKLTHLHNIIKETLRLFPAAPFLIPHESSEDCTVSGYHVPKGTMLLVNVYAMQRDPELWGDDPLKFMPERFGEGDHGLGVQVKGSSYRYMPFGAGRRRCPGESLAWRLMELTLGTLIQCFEWGRVGEEMVDLSEGDGLTMPMAKPLKAICKPRSNMIHLLSQL